MSMSMVDESCSQATADAGKSSRVESRRSAIMRAWTESREYKKQRCARTRLSQREDVCSRLKRGVGDGEGRVRSAAQHKQHVKRVVQDAGFSPSAMAMMEGAMWYAQDWRGQGWRGSIVVRPTAHAQARTVEAWGRVDVDVRVSSGSDSGGERKDWLGTKKREYGYRVKTGTRDTGRQTSESTNRIDALLQAEKRASHRPCHSLAPAARAKSGS